MAVNKTQSQNTLVNDRLNQTYSYANAQKLKHGNHNDQSFSPSEINNSNQSRDYTTERGHPSFNRNKDFISVTTANDNKSNKNNLSELLDNSTNRALAMNQYIIENSSDRNGHQLFSRGKPEPKNNAKRDNDFEDEFRTHQIGIQNRNIIINDVNSFVGSGQDIKNSLNGIPSQVRYEKGRMVERPLGK